MFGVYPDVSLCGIAAAVPEKFVENIHYSNSIDEKMILRQGRLTGVDSRYLCSDGQTLSDLLIPPAKQLITGKKINRDNIRVLIVVTETPDYKIPATANKIQHQLELPEQCICMDVNQGCAGSAVGIQLMCAMLSGQKQGIIGLLLMGNAIYDFTDEERKNPDIVLNQMIYGSGGAALAFEVKETAEPIICETLSYGCYAENICVKKDGSAVNDALHVVDFNHDIWAKNFLEFKSKIENLNGQTDFYLLNQSQKMILDTMIKASGIEREKVLFSIQTLGDTYSAAPFITLCFNHNEIVKPRSHMLLAVSGSGMTCGFTYFNIASDYIFELLYL